MNNILLVGNGFDLAHGLATKYEHFLYLMKNWDDFYSAYTIARMNGNKRIIVKGYIQYEEWSEEIDFYLKNVSNMDKSWVDELCIIVHSNNWVKYYCSCGAEIDGWIDFEREICPVMELFDFAFKANYATSGHGGEFGEAHIEKATFSPKLLRIARLWTKYFDVSGGNSVCVKEPYASLQYGILKKKILDDLRKEFEKFIFAFEIYLHEFVYKIEEVKILKQIKALEIGNVISFNYTLTERLYGMQAQDVHHIHGMIRDDLSTGKNNMVVGVNEQENQNMDFIYFVKYFQRIQKGSGVKYKKFIDDNLRLIKMGLEKESYLLYIYGHSLDETDEDILKYVIGDTTDKRRINFKPKKVIIFFYDSQDYEQKVINLIKLYGRSIVEEYMEKELFKFIPTNDEVWSEK